MQPPLASFRWPVTFLAALVFAAQIQAAPVFTSELVANLPVVDGPILSSNPGPGVEMSGFFYFFATDGALGRELWRTDGTAAGTTLVKDIRPGSEGSPTDASNAGDTGQLFLVGSTIFFIADDGVHGKELWKSDGTPAGTVLAVDLTPGPADTNFYYLRAGASALWFVVLIGADEVLYKTDGTAAGTVAITGPSGVATTEKLFTFAAPFGSSVVFLTQAATGLKMWRSDGTAAGSQLLESPLDMSGIGGLFPLGSEVYIFGLANIGGSSRDVIKRRSLTPGGTAQLVESVDSTTGGVAYRGQTATHLFYASDTTSGSTHTHVLASVTAGQMAVLRDSVVDSSNNTSFFQAGVLGSNFYYYLTGSTQLKRTDGLTNGVLGVDLATLGITQAGSFALAGTRLFFSGTNAAKGTEPGLTNGTPGGTALFDAVAGTASSNPTLLGTLGGLIFFSADDGVNGRELWKTDGTQVQTVLVKDIAPGTATVAPVEAVAIGNTLFMSMDSPGNGRELWKSDGTTAGMVLVKDIQPGALGSNPANLTVFNGALYFTADDGTNGVELWKSDGTDAGTVLLKNIRSGSGSSSPAQFAAANGVLYFVADDGAHGAELWRTDGTPAGTYLEADTVFGSSSGQIGNLTAVGASAYFKASIGAGGVELWTSNDQPGGTQPLADLVSGSSDPKNFVAFGGAVYFLEGVNKFLWKTDGTGAGTAFVKSGGFETMRSAGSYLFLSVGDALWTSDGTGVNTIQLLDTGLTTSLAQLTTVGTSLYFQGGDDVWISDGTPEGTVRAADFPDTTSTTDSPAMFTQFGGALIFTEKNVVFGRELWSIAPGVGAGLIEDLVPGAADADIRLLTPAADRIYYFARPPGQASWQLRALHLQNLVAPRTAFPSLPTVPGKVEAENFDTGGEGVAYHDATPFNEGGSADRTTEGVDLEACNDTGGGFCVADTAAGEWLEYSVNVATPGMYRVDVRVAAAAAGGAFHLEVDGVAEGGSTAIPGTGSTQTWTTVLVNNVALNSGTHIVRLSLDSANASGDLGRFNSLDFVFVAANQPPVVTVADPDQGAISATGDALVLRASNADTTTGAPVQSQFFIDGVGVGTGSGPNAARSWLATAGAHLLRIVTTDSFGASTTSRGRLFFVTDPVLPFGSLWKYFDGGTNLGTAWRAPAFNDNALPQGRGQLGFGDGDERTVINGGNVSNQHITTYFRTRFTPPTPYNYGSFKLLRDDGAVVYLNGTEIARSNMPAGTIIFTTLASSDVGGFFGTGENTLFPFNVPLSAFTAGQNVLAVEVHQSGATTNFDLSFDLEFYTFSYRPDPPLISRSGNNTSLTWPDYLEDWQLEESSDLLTWTTVHSAPTIATGIATVTLASPAPHFYRLHQISP
jgi:ELWxxDGT repeat protein